MDCERCLPLVEKRAEFIVESDLMRLLVCHDCAEQARELKSTGAGKLYVRRIIETEMEV